MKQGRFVYKNADSMNKMHEFYDRTLDSLGIPFSDTIFIWENIFIYLLLGELWLEKK